MHVLRRIHAAAFILVSGAAAATAQTYQLGPIEISVPWTRAMPPAANAGGGFMTISNSGTTDDRLVSATSPVAAEVQIHTMDMTDGVMRMRELVDGLPIPAGATVQLAPGGYHVMFLELPAPIAIDTAVSVTLVFERAGEITIDLAVVPPGAPGPEGAGGMGAMGGMGGMNMGGAAMPMGLDTNTPEWVLMAAFGTPESHLSVAPMVTSGDFAIAGWVQGEMAGRALLRRTDGAWAIVLRAGDGLRVVTGLVDFGVPEADAATLVTALLAAEATMDPALVARFSTFHGVVMMDAEGHHPPAGAAH